MRTESPLAPREHQYDVTGYLVLDQFRGGWAALIEKPMKAKPRVRRSRAGACRASNQEDPHGHRLGRSVSDCAFPPSLLTARRRCLLALGKFGKLTPTFRCALHKSFCLRVAAVFHQAISGLCSLPIFFRSIHGIAALPRHSIPRLPCHQCRH